MGKQGMGEKLTIVDQQLLPSRHLLQGDKHEIQAPLRCLHLHQSSVGLCATPMSDVSAQATELRHVRAVICCAEKSRLHVQTSEGFTGCNGLGSDRHALNMSISTHPA